MSANDATGVVVYQLDEVACKYTFLFSMSQDYPWWKSGPVLLRDIQSMPSLVKEAW